MQQTGFDFSGEVDDILADGGRADIPDQLRYVDSETFWKSIGLSYGYFRWKLEISKLKPCSPQMCYDELDSYAAELSERLCLALCFDVDRNAWDLERGFRFMELFHDHDDWEARMLAAEAAHRDYLVANGHPSNVCGKPDYQLHA